MPVDDTWDHWDQAIVHGRRGVSRLAFGLNRLDTVSGPGARDVQWLGVLARVGPGGVRVCRPRADRRAWLYTYPDIARWSTRLTFRCAGLRLRVRDSEHRDLDEFISHVEVRSRTVGRTGLSAHLAHPVR